MKWYEKVWKYAYTKPNEYLFGKDTNEQNRARADAWLQDKTPWTNTTGTNWYELIQRQRENALGLRPSLAEAQYRQGMGDTQAALSSAGNATSRPGAMRAALQQQANIGQGLAAGLAQAGMQERVANEQSYMTGLQNTGAVEDTIAQRIIELLQTRMGVPTSPSRWDRAASALPLLAMFSKNNKQPQA